MLEDSLDDPLPDGRVGRQRLSVVIDGQGSNPLSSRTFSGTCGGDDFDCQVDVLMDRNGKIDGDATGMWLFYESGEGGNVSGVERRVAVVKAHTGPLLKLETVPVSPGEAINVDFSKARFAMEFPYFEYRLHADHLKLSPNTVSRYSASAYSIAAGEIIPVIDVFYMDIFGSLIKHGDHSNFTRKRSSGVEVEPLKMMMHVCAADANERPCLKQNGLITVRDTTAIVDQGVARFTDVHFHGEPGRTYNVTFQFHPEQVTYSPLFSTLRTSLLVKVWFQLL